MHGKADEQAGNMQQGVVIIKVDNIDRPREGREGGRE